MVKITQNKNPEKDLIIKRKKEELINTWQERWGSTSKAPWTHKLVPDVRVRMNTPIWTNHYLSQFLTRHGDFRDKLHSLGLADSPTCTCGHANETPEHLIYNCPRIIPQREKLKSAVTNSGQRWPCEPHVLLSTRAIFRAFDNFARDTLINK